MPRFFYVVSTNTPAPEAGWSIATIELAGVTLVFVEVSRG
jgi:hypothetical protein